MVGAATRIAGKAAARNRTAAGGARLMLFSGKREIHRNVGFVQLVPTCAPRASALKKPNQHGGPQSPLGDTQQFW